MRCRIVLRKRSLPPLPFGVDGGESIAARVAQHLQFTNADNRVKYIFTARCLVREKRTEDRGNLAVILVLDHGRDLAIPSAALLDVEHVLRTMLVDPEARTNLPWCAYVIHGDAFLLDLDPAVLRMDFKVLEVHRTAEDDDDAECPGGGDNAPDSGKQSEQSDDREPYAPAFHERTFGGTPLEEDVGGGICVQIIKLYRNLGFLPIRGA